MNISKSLLEAAAKIAAQPVNQHSSRGNYVLSEEHLAEDKVTVVHKGDGGHHRITVGTIKVGPHAGKHFVDAKFDTSNDPHKPSGHGSTKSLANYVHKGNGTAEKRSKLHNALVAAHKTGDKKKVLAAVKEHGYSHHNWQLHESEQLDEANSYASEAAAKAVAQSLSKKHADAGFSHGKHPEGGYKVTHSTIHGKELSKMIADLGDKKLHEEMTDDQKAHAEHIVKSLKSDAEGFKKRYGVDWEGVMYATANKMAMKEDVDTEVMEILGEARYGHLARGESSGRHYKDEHGVTWDDEGHSDHGHINWGRGPQPHLHRGDQARKHFTKPAATKHYHEVPYAKKEDAKREGMKWHAEKKKWYHTDAAKSATSKFKKLHEEELSEELRERLAANAAENKDRTPIAGVDKTKKTEDKRGLHRVAVTVSDPNHPAVSQRKETVQKFVKVRAGGRFEAEGNARRHYQKQGYKVHDVNHHSEIKEEVEGVLTSELFTEEHATREAAQKRLEAIEKKHPLAKHSVIQGRRTGKWHIVRHTSGGMHVVEGYEPEFDELIEDCGLDSKGDWQSYKSKADKKKSDGIDDDGGDKKAKDNIKEGDESEADYQAYLKSLKDKKDKTKSTIKSVRGK